MARFRRLKPHVLELLRAEQWEANLDEVLSFEPRQVVGPLFSSLLHAGELRWRGITALGLVVARLAEERMEEARIIMRRFIWNLNEESGNVAWGAPESMAEAMVNHEGLAREYHRILISYVRDMEPGNYLDHPPLRRCAWWGIGRLAHARPELLAPALDHVLAGLNEEDVPSRGLAAWTLAGLAKGLGAETLFPEPHMLARTRGALTALATNTTEMELFENRRLADTRVADLALRALHALAD